VLTHMTARYYGSNAMTHAIECVQAETMSEAFGRQLLEAKDASELGFGAARLWTVLQTCLSRFSALSHLLTASKHILLDSTLRHEPAAPASIYLTCYQRRSADYRKVPHVHIDEDERSTCSFSCLYEYA
jgi:hypothetical protein